MSYEINDRSLIDELCGEIHETVEKMYDEYKCRMEEDGKTIPNEFVHPLDNEIIGSAGILKKLLPEKEQVLSYAKAEELDKLWKVLLDKAIRCLRYFDNREPFIDNPAKTIVAYGIDKLEAYHRRYTEFEGLMYGASSYYRDHVFHAVRVWMLGVFCLLKQTGSEDPFYSKIKVDGGAIPPREINFFECVSMWTVAALCHDLGYPLEKAEQILEKTRKMMKEFIPNPSVWSNFSYSGTQDNINEYILKFISTKMKERKPLDKTEDKKEEGLQEDQREFLGRIQPKYYLKYAKSLENFQHGIISTVIVYKMLLYFLESDFNLNDDYIYKAKDAQQFYIRREILRAMASHTCPDAYNIHIATFPSLLFICDELQEWGRKTWNELYTGLNEDSVSLLIEKFTTEEIIVQETIDMKSIEDPEIITQNICRVFERQYSLYKTTFRDGQDTSKRDFGLKKTMKFELRKNGAETQEIIIEYGLPKTKPSYFKVILTGLTGTGSKKKRNSYAEGIEAATSNKLYYKDIKVIAE